MARDLTPKWKRCRRAKFSLFDNDNWKRRPTLPGVHGVSRSHPTGYGIRFAEKQKVKRIYGLLEKQFIRFFNMALKSKGNTGERLLQLLELRLDNVVYRLGLGTNRNVSRQLVNHGHVFVNGKKIDIPSVILNPGDEIYLKDSVKKKDFGKVLIAESRKARVPVWLEKLPGGGKVKSVPTRDMLDRGINEQLIVEFYSR